MTLVTRPTLLWEAARSAFALRRRGGLRPGAEYLAWRVHTAYGGEVGELPAEDLAAFLSWRRLLRALR